MLFFVLLAGFFFLSQDGYKELSRTAISTIFFVSKFDFMFQFGYFAGESELKPLCHVYLYGNGVLYFNYSHLSIAGAEMLVKFIP
jgi:peptidoglycan/LPS O-acetylase OafA/YrhL